MKTEFEDQRDHLWQKIDQLMARKQLREVRQARQMLRDWMRQYPDDYYSQDGGEELAMMEGALEIVEAQQLAEPVAA